MREGSFPRRWRGARGWGWVALPALGLLRFSDRRGLSADLWEAEGADRSRSPTVCSEPGVGQQSRARGAEAGGGCRFPKEQPQRAGWRSPGRPASQATGPALAAEAVSRVPSPVHPSHESSWSGARREIALRRGREQAPLLQVSTSPSVSALCIDRPTPHGTPMTPLPALRSHASPLAERPAQEVALHWRLAALPNPRGALRKRRWSASAQRRVDLVNECVRCPLSLGAPGPPIGPRREADGRPAQGPRWRDPARPPSSAAATSAGQSTEGGGVMALVLAPASPPAVGFIKRSDGGDCGDLCGRLFLHDLYDLTIRRLTTCSLAPTLTTLALRAPLFSPSPALQAHPFEIERPAANHIHQALSISA